METWMASCLAGRAEAEEIDDFIEEWHYGGGPGLPLHEFLGLTHPEYVEWVEQKATAHELVERRRVGERAPGKQSGERDEGDPGRGQDRQE
jgi:hypothetical protein